MSMELIMQSPPESHPDIREMAKIVRRQSEHLDHLVGDLLDRSRIESGNFELRLQECDLGHLADDAAKLYQVVSPMHQITLLLSKEPVLCVCDPARIAQVLNNLVSNAIKYSPHGGLIAIQVGRRGVDGVVTVSDQGMGIGTEDREHIFEPFRRSKATRETIPGVGLGLAVSRRLLEAHGGRIEAESELGKGSLFTIRLPLAPLSRRSVGRKEYVACPPGGLSLSKNLMQ
jgi:signal transduction histidine kinase